MKVKKYLNTLNNLTLLGKAEDMRSKEMKMARPAKDRRFSGFLYTVLMMMTTIPATGSRTATLKGIVKAK